MVKCSVCGKDKNSLLRVKHRKIGQQKSALNAGKWKMEIIIFFLPVVDATAADNLTFQTLRLT